MGASAKKARRIVEPQGAYVDLNHLQQLRYLAEPIPLSVRLGQLQAASGRHRSRALSRGMEFEEVRLYQPGDDVRNIDWRVTARTQTTHTKRYRDEKEKPVITLVDQRRSLFFGSHHCFKSVYACHLAALFNWSVLKRGDRAGGLVIGTRSIDETRPVCTHKGINRWLHCLTQFNHQLELESRHSEPSFNDALKQLLRITRKGTECILISDCYDLNHQCEELLFRLTRHNHVSLFWLIDHLEKKLPLLQNISISNGQQKTVLSIDKQLQQQMQQGYLQKQAYLKDMSLRLGMTLQEIDTEQSLTESANQSIRKR